MTFDAGSIDSTLRMDRSPWQRELEAAKSEAAEFSRNPIKVNLELNGLTKITADLDKLKAKLDDIEKKRTIRVEAQTGVSEAKLARLQAQLDDLTRVRRIRPDVDGHPAEDELDRIKRKADGTHGSFSLLGTAIAALATFAAPVVATSVGMAGALAGVGAAGLLAFKGIQNEIAQGTPQGVAYDRIIQGLQGNLKVLEGTAAAGVLGPFRTMVTDLNRQMPLLNGEVYKFAKTGGQIGANFLQTAFVGFRAFSPLINQVDTDLLHLSQRILTFANGGGFEKFTSYAMQQLPGVEHMLGELFTLIGHLSIGLAGFGGSGVSAITLLSHLINGIPLPVMKVLVPLITAGYLAWQLYNSSIVPVIETYKKVTAALKAYQTAQLVSSGLSQEEAAARASAAGGLGAMASKYGLIAGVAVVAATGVILANNALVDNFRTFKAGAANVSDAEVILKRIGSTGKYTADDLHGLGVQSGNLGNVIENAFRESTLTKIKDFQFGLGGIIHLPFNSATQDQKNFFKSVDGALTDLVANGKINLANTYLKNLADQSGMSVDEITSKLPGFKAAIDAIANSAIPVYGPSGVLMASTATLEKLADSYGLTAAQAQNYATMVGIGADDIKKNTVSEATLEKAVKGVSYAFASGNAATQDYLKAVDTFSKSAGTAADRAALIGATLLAANGDNLQYASSMNAAAKANQSLVDVMAAGALKTVNWKTGIIDFNNAAADPLITALGQLQTSAEQAAEAQYLHEKSIIGGKAAADAAYTTYVARTQGALIDEAQKFGMNATQAKKFADQYFGLTNAKDIKKKIEQAGGDSVISVLQKIANDLDIIAGKKPRPKVDINDAATPKLLGLAGLLNNLTKPKTIPVTVQNTGIPPSLAHLGGGTNGPPQATGGLLSGPGTGTSDSMLIRASNGEFVMNARATQAFLPELHDMNNKVPAFASGGQVGNPFTGVTYQGAAARNAAGKPVKASTKVTISGITYASAAAAQNAITRFTQSVVKDAAAVVASLSGSAAALASRTSKLISDAEKTGKVSSTLAAQVGAENAQLIKYANDRAFITAKLKWANANLAAEQAKYNNQFTTGRDQVLGSFNASTGGGGTSVIGFQANLDQKVLAAQKFAANIAKLKHEGLNDSALQQLIAGGPDQSGVNASLLAAANAGQIKQINTSYASLGVAANTVGKTGADALYLAGVNAAKGLVAGLKSQENALDKAMSHLAQRMVAALKAALGIHSPSTVIADEVGFHIPGGAAVGIERGTPIAVAAVKQLANRVKASSGFSVPIVGNGQTAASGATVDPVVHQLQQLRKEIAVLTRELSENLGDTFDGSLSKAAQKTHELELIRKNQNGS